MYITADGFPDDENYEEPSEIYSAGYVFMRYFAKQAATTTFAYDTYHKTVSVDSLNFAINYWDKVTMRSSANTDTITNNDSNVTINGGAGDDYLKNSGGKHITYSFGKNLGNARLQRLIRRVKPRKLPPCLQMITSSPFTAARNKSARYLAKKKPRRSI